MAATGRKGKTELAGLPPTTELLDSSHASERPWSENPFGIVSLNVISAPHTRATSVTQGISGEATVGYKLRRISGNPHDSSLIKV